jgi:transcriptional regulator with XRE-family HTH domain
MKKISPAARLVGRRFNADPEYQEMLAEARVRAQVSQAIYDARSAAGLSQQELGERIGTSQPAIARLEDGDYDRHSVAVLRRIADALNLTLSIQFDPPKECDVTSEVTAETVRQIVREELQQCLPTIRSEIQRTLASASHIVAAQVTNHLFSLTETASSSRARELPVLIGHKEISAIIH